MPKSNAWKERQKKQKLIALMKVKKIPGKNQFCNQPEIIDFVDLGSGQAEVIAKFALKSKRNLHAIDPLYSKDFRFEHDSNAPGGIKYFLKGVPFVPYNIPHKISKAYSREEILKRLVDAKSFPKLIGDDFLKVVDKDYKHKKVKVFNISFSSPLCCEEDLSDKKYSAFLINFFGVLKHRLVSNGRLFVVDEASSIALHVPLLLSVGFRVRVKILIPEKAFTAWEKEFILQSNVLNDFKRMPHVLIASKPLKNYNARQLFEDFEGSLEKAK